MKPALYCLRTLLSTNQQSTHAFRVVFYSVPELHGKWRAKDWCFVLMILMLLADSFNPHSAALTEKKKRRQLNACHVKDALFYSASDASSSVPASVRFRRVRKTTAKRNYQLRTSLLPQGSERLPSRGFSWNFIFTIFTKICRQVPIVVKIWHKQHVLSTINVHDFSPWLFYTIKKDHILCEVSAEAEETVDHGAVRMLDCKSLVSTLQDCCYKSPCLLYLNENRLLIYC